MKKSRKAITTILFAILAAIIIIGIVIASKGQAKGKIVSVSSKKELNKIYDNYGDSFEIPEILEYFLEFTIFPFNEIISPNHYNTKGVDTIYSTTQSISGAEIPTGSIDTSSASSPFALKSFATSNVSEDSSKSYSKTNIQVENVDEADINKTDGDYIYSISNNKVLITDVRKPNAMDVVGAIDEGDTKVPVDLILDTEERRLVVIYEDVSSSTYQSDTYVKVYDISDLKKLKTEKSFKINAKYYTSRATNGYIYIISTGNMRETKDEVDISYIEDNISKEIDLNNIQYKKGQAERYQTIIASYKIGSKQDINVHSYLFGVDNVYVSENNIYLVNDSYGYDNDDTLGSSLKELYGLKGIWGYIVSKSDYIGSKYNEKTQINKININKDGTSEYVNTATITGTTLNQFSMDEYNKEFRIALYESGEGSRIVVFDEDLNEIGSTEYFEKTEKMYSSRFIGNRAYLVTYRNMDPLFVIDLSDGENPRLLGKLEIPGYSTYLQAYDENHIIGIGMNSETIVNKNSNGRVTTSSTQITGMKMALFDVTDVTNPKQISQTLIGDRYTTSAVLDNHKALLFSREKGIICIPVNTYDSAIMVEDSNSTQAIETNYRKYISKSSKKSEGYLVYNLNLKDGFVLKGAITHRTPTSTKYTNNELLRGLWIEDNLFTISQYEMKSTRLSDLKLLDDLSLTTYEHYSIPKEDVESSSNNQEDNSSNTVTTKSTNETEE